MCTVTYFPHKSGFVLTHNRDEAASRSNPSIVRGKSALGDTLLFPRDSLAGGTWICSASSGRTACLMNGAFVRHERQPPYRRSRGLLLLDFFDWADPDNFFQHYDFEGIEPFTFLFFETQRLLELRWDGREKYLKPLSPEEPRFWCSATLYPPEMQVRREQVFREWLGNHPNSRHPQSLLHLHLHGSVGDPEYNFVMNRGGRVQTVSVTQVVVDEKNARMRYLELLGGNRGERRFSYPKRGADED